MKYEDLPPWNKPGYKGKLKQTVNIQMGPKPIPIDDLIEATLELMLEGVLTQERTSEILTHYDELKKQGKHHL